MSSWRDGRILDGDAEALAEDRALLLGDGLYETVHVRRGEALFLADHVARLLRSAAALAFEPPTALGAAVATALPRLVEREGRPERGVLRITLSRGRGRGLAVPSGPPGLVLTFGALPDAPSGVPAPAVRALLVDAPRVDPRDPLAGHKVVSSMARVEARRRARLVGADVAVLSTTDGDVCEADAANVFAVLDGVVVTPSLDRGVLPGITRARALRALRAAGVRAEERRLSSLEWAHASAAFLTSSLDGVRPVAGPDGRPPSGSLDVARWLAARIDGCGAGSHELIAPDGLARTE